VNDIPAVSIKHRGGKPDRRPPSIPSRKSASGASRRAFSLIELLVVIAIIVALAGLASVSLTSVASNSAMAEASAQLRGTIETARQSAVATGTYHYVGLRSNNDPLEFEVVTFRSLGGALSHDTHTSPDSALVEQAGRRTLVRRTAIEDAPPELSRLETRPTDQQLDAAGKTSASKVKFKVTSGGTTGDFDRVIEITPRGQVRVPGDTAAAAIKIFLVPRGTAPSLVWVHADTGFVEEFR